MVMFLLWCSYCADFFRGGVFVLVVVVFALSSWTAHLALWRCLWSEIICVVFFWWSWLRFYGGVAVVEP